MLVGSNSTLQYTLALLEGFEKNVVVVAHTGRTCHAGQKVIGDYVMLEVGNVALHL